MKETDQSYSLNLTDELKLFSLDQSRSTSKYLQGVMKIKLASSGEEFLTKSEIDDAFFEFETWIDNQKKAL